MDREILQREREREGERLCASFLKTLPLWKSTEWPLQKNERRWMKSRRFA